MQVDEDLVEFIKTGKKVGEDSFRKYYGFCPRKILHMLVHEGILYKSIDLHTRKVCYELTENIFIQENRIPLGDLNLDDDGLGSKPAFPPPPILPPELPLKKPKQKRSLFAIHLKDKKNL